MNEQFYDFLLVLFSSSQPALYLKTGDIEFSFILIPDCKSLLKVGMNLFDRMFYLNCDNFGEVYANRKIIGFFHMKILAYSFVEALW